MAKQRQLSSSPLLTADQLSQFAEKLENYRVGVQKIYDKYWADNEFTHNAGSTAIIQDGSRYIKLFMVEKNWLDREDHSKGVIFADLRISPKQIHSFIDKLTGDVLKPASYKAPAKHARGNLFDAANGLATVNWFGPGYLR